MVLYNTKILNVDLSSGKVEEEELDKSVYEEYVGGYGLAVRLLYKRIPAGADPLGPDNILGFFPGLLTGSMIPFTGRYVVCAKSPLTKQWGDSNSGGFFGPEIQRCGYAGILFSGKSEKPVYLLIKDGQASLEDASELWGLDAVETDEKLQEEHGKRIRVSAIGQAGENLCLNAGVVNDRGRTAARAGLGTVMGSKKLKALALKGKNRFQYEDRKALMPLIKDYQKHIKKIKESKLNKLLVDGSDPLVPLLRIFKIPIFSTAGMAASYMSRYGTPYSTMVSTETGDSPVKNWDGVGHDLFGKEKSNPLTSQHGLNEWKEKSYGCFSCPIRCGAILSVPEAGVEETHRPEYETLSAFGPLILNEDVNTLIQANEYMNRAAIDSISAGGICAFAIECFENGIITKEDTGGLELEWGNSDIILPLLKMIVNREKIGDILADGVKRAAEKLGNGAEKYAVHANGQELPMHNSKYSPSLATTYVADPTPGRHTAASCDFLEVGPIAKFIKGLDVPKSKRYKYDTKGPAQAKLAKVYQTVNALGYCMFGAWMGEMPVLEFIKNSVGWDLDVDDLVEIGYRIQTLRQLFNVKHGAVQFDINDRAIGAKNPMKKGPLKGVSLDVKTMVRDYFENMEWDPETGIPKEKTMEKLNLGFAKDALKHADSNQTVEDLPEV